MQQAATDIVHTVVDELGAWAFLPDETAALEYAAKVHGKLGQPMTRQQAHELVRQNYEARFGSLSHQRHGDTA